MNMDSSHSTGVLKPGITLSIPRYAISFDVKTANFDDKKIPTFADRRVVITN